MKKFATATVLFFFFIGSFAQSDTINKFNSKGQKNGYWLKKENGTLVYEGRFINDKPIGTFKYYYSNGKIKNISRFQKNGSISYTTTYHPNGQISSMGKFIDKQRDSIWVYYNDAGKKISSESFKNGLSNGKWEKFDPKTEVLLDERNFLNGKKHGSWKTFYTTGQLRYEMVYKEDVAEGPYKCYYIDGRIWHTGFYKNSYFDSTWVSYTADGQMIKRVKYRKIKVIESQLVAYNSKGIEMIPINKIAYFVTNQKGVDIYLRDGRVVLTKTEFTDLQDFLSDDGFIKISDIMMVSPISIIKITPEGKDAFLLDLKPNFGIQVLVVGPYAEYLRSTMNKKESAEKPIK